MTSPEPVQKVIVTHNDRDFTILTLSVTPVRGPPSSGDDSGKSQTLTTTWHHPFWDAGRQRWVDAHDLTPGTNDLTVGKLHTCYVGAGAILFLVTQGHDVSPRPALCCTAGMREGRVSRDISIRRDSSSRWYIRTCDGVERCSRGELG
ncbi:hypothetical protein ABZX85_19735 [Streptomyces sp. NPDC004539]|uniref:hypothetical protein n=1 Tax=Streptomyces sp. NPDC004539 TaxID=3154280 RepID=UPI00339F744C